MHTELNGKRLELLRTAFPQITAVSALVNPANAASKLAFEQTETAARSLGLGNVRRVEAESAAALRALRPEVNEARLPAIYPEREYAADGGLMAYGTNAPDNFRQAADYVDRILRGGKPGDLPIQEPVKFDFVVNLKTARELNLTLPANDPRPRDRGHRMRSPPSRRAVMVAGAITVLGRGAVWAQESNRTYRLGISAGTPRQAPQWVAFFDELGKAGFIEAKNLTVVSVFPGPTPDTSPRRRSWCKWLLTCS